MSRRFAVFGHPIGHSRSPWIHARFAEQTGVALTYEREDIAPGSFPERVQAFFAGGGIGLNITVPYKEDAWRLCQRLSPRAGLAQAVNTLWNNEQGELCGDNTDGIGLVRDLRRNLGVMLTGARVLLVGAGGAGRGVARPLLEEQPAKLTISNRSPDKAEALVAELQESVTGSSTRLNAIALDACGRDRYDLVINATSSGLSGDRPALDPAVFAPGALAYDMVYGPGQTPFQRWAEASGAARSADGVGMLVEQAAESFTIWNGIRPDTARVIADLRADLAGG